MSVPYTPASAHDLGFPQEAEKHGRRGTREIPGQMMDLGGGFAQFHALRSVDRVDLRGPLFRLFLRSKT